MSIRPIKRIIQSEPTIEGAGVRLRRAFGFGATGDYDPFLLLDDFRNDTPADYQAGFPWHPHRGIETITYVLAGSVDHGDSLGNSGALGAGDVQWMTAGSGILHQEMPKGDARGRMHGFQLWANLPSALKMTHPRYQDIPSAAVPEVTDDDGTKARIIVGSFWGRRAPWTASPRSRAISTSGSAGPAQDAARRQVAPCLRVRVRGLGHVPRCIGSAGVLTERVGADAPVLERTGNRSLVLFDDGDDVTVQAGDEGIRFLLVSGRPIEEPVAWYGPIVMNTREQLQQAFSELRDGTFIKHG